jgi:D-aspartate ligase
MEVTVTASTQAEEQRYRAPAVVLGVGWANGLGLIRSLGQAGVPVLALDPKPGAIGFVSRYVTQARVCPDPGDEEPAFLAFMEELGEALEQPGVLFLTRDQDVSAVSRNQAQLEPYFLIPFAEWEVLRQIVDKRGQYAVAREAGVPLPQTAFPQSETEVTDAVADLPFPLLIKPAYHAGFSQTFGVKGFVADTPAQALEQYARGAEAGYEMMLQEIIPGNPDRLYTYGSYVGPQGDPLAEFTGRKLRQNPRMFGTCRVGECCPAPPVAELGLRLLRALGFWGISQVEFKLDPRDGAYKLMEVNARNYQWQHLATLCGANLALAAYRDALGEPVTPSVATNYGRRWVLTASDLALTPRELLRGQISLGAWLRSWRGVVADGIFSWRDPQPGLRYLDRQILGRAEAGS